MVKKREQRGFADAFVVIVDGKRIFIELQ